MVQSWMGTSETETGGMQQDEEQAHEAAVKLRKDLRDGQGKERRRRSRFVELLGAEDREAPVQRFPDAFEYEAVEAAALGEVSFGARVVRAADSATLQRRATIGSGDEGEAEAGVLKRGAENRRCTFPTSAKERLARNNVLEERVRRSLEGDDEYQVTLERIGRLDEYEELFVDVDEETSLLGEEEEEEEEDGDLVLVRVQRLREDGGLKKVWSRTEREESRRRRERYRESRLRRWCRQLRSFLAR